jgi:pimeloyl-ACP methyl ester carboxylesterase
MNEINYLETEHGKLAYQYFNRNSECGVIFLGGLASNMMGTKATYLKDFCEDNGISFTRFDYFGHGMSDGDIKLGNISIWRDNAESILNDVTDGKQILVGSSMSGWIMCLLAEKYPDKVKGLIGIAAAPDFTEDFYNSLDANGIKNLNEKKYITIDRYSEELIITKNLLDDGKNNLLFNRDLNFNIPIILMHGMADNIVSYKKSIQLAEKISTKNIQVVLIKNADHNMKDPKSLEILSDSIKKLCTTKKI